MWQGELILNTLSANSLSLAVATGKWLCFWGSLLERPQQWSNIAPLHTDRSKNNKQKNPKQQQKYLDEVT